MKEGKLDGEFEEKGTFFNTKFPFIFIFKDQRKKKRKKMKKKNDVCGK